MASILGFTALLAIIILGLTLPFLNFLILKKKIALNTQTFSEIVFSFTFLIFALAFFAQFCLIYSYIISDYSVLNVYQNSHHLKPLLYKITGSWGNHEGSLLLLLTIISFYSFSFALLNKSNFKDLTLVIQNAIIALITIFTAFASNPFTTILPQESGLGLNPLLQDIGLALHPPMLYTGYIGFSLTFSLAICALLKEQVNKDLAKIMRLWIFISWSFLTLGIALGSWWAYRELGWGGYWFWDPVENVSLMPWLAATALLHSVMMLEKKGIFKIWTILLSLINFTLCLIGIFLVRSGLLTSVHSFAADAKRGFFIIILISIISGFGFLIFALKTAKIKSEEKEEIKIFSKIGMILFNNYLLTTALFTVFLGSLYPIFAESFFNQSIFVGANYYNKIFTILLIPFLVFLIWSYFLHYSKNNILFNPSQILSILSSLAISLFIYLKYEINFSEFLLLFLSILSCILAFLSKKKAANIAHLGFAVLIVGILLSSVLNITKEINIKQNEEVKINDNVIKFKDVEYEAGSNYLARLAVFTIFKNNQEIAILKPALHYYPISKQTTYEADIKHFIFGDLYLVVGNKDENENYALRIYYKPFIYLIWLGCALMFLAGLMKVKKLLF